MLRCECEHTVLQRFWNWTEKSMLLESLNLHVSSLSCSCMFLQSEEDVFFINEAFNHGGQQKEWGQKVFLSENCICKNTISIIKDPENSPQNLPIFHLVLFRQLIDIITERKKEKPEFTMKTMTTVHMTDSAFVCLELTSNSHPQILNKKCESTAHHWNSQLSFYTCMSYHIVLYPSN